MKVIKSADLRFVGGGSDKVYLIELMDLEYSGPGGPYEVNFQYGRRGSALTSGKKTAKPVTLATANKVYDKLYAEKTGKGYRDVTSGAAAAIPASSPSRVVGTTVSPTLPQLLNPVKDDKQLDDLIQDPEWVMQEKVDGERRLIRVTKGAVIGYNRRGVEVALPSKITAAFAQGTVDFLLDGELVGDSYYIFDAISDAGGKTIDRIFVERLSFLDSLGFRREQLSKATPESPVMRVVSAHSIQEKRQLLADVRATGGEGVVFKRRDSLYMPGRPNSGGDQLKYKLYETAVVSVFGARTGVRSVRIAVLTDASGNAIEDVGNVTIPPNVQIPASGDHLEVRYLYAYPGGSLYQPVFLRVRRDVDTADTLDSLKFKTIVQPAVVQTVDPAAFLAW